jgi:hypothetical protein
MAAIPTMEIGKSKPELPNPNVTIGRKCNGQLDLGHEGMADPGNGGPLPKKQLWVKGGQARPLSELLALYRPGRLLLSTAGPGLAAFYPYP